MNAPMTREERERGLEALRHARHSNALEGLRECREDGAVVDACARGEISDDESRRRIMARIAQENEAR